MIFPLGYILIRWVKNKVRTGNVVGACRVCPHLWEATCTYDIPFDTIYDVLLRHL